jgi:hypothetical protein
MEHTTITGRMIDSRIDINETYELEYWSEKFKVSKARVRQAVRAVGPMSSPVERYITIQRRALRLIYKARY